MCKQYLQEENQIYEKKASISNEKKILRTICAFANTEGGTLAIGIDNNKIIGVKNIDKIQQKIYNLIKNNLNPIPLFEIKVEKFKDKEVIAIYIFPMSEGQICTYNGKTYIRTGSVNHLIEGTQLSQFILQKGIISFEDQLNNAPLKDIDETKVENYLNLRNSQKKQNLKSVLINLKLAEQNISFKLKNLALLLFAKDITKHFPQCGIKIVVFQDSKPINIKAHTIIQDTIFELIEKTIAFIKQYTLKSIEIKGIKRIEEYQYPEEVIRELVVNAIGHRNYFDQNLVQISIFPDRIEFANPSVFVPNFSLEDLGKIAIHRNPNLYIHLSFAKYCEGYGTGIPRVREILQKQNYLLPEFNVIGNWFKVIVFDKEKHKLEEFILQEIKGKGKITTTELKESLKISKVSVIKYLNKLIKKGIIKKQGKGKNTKYIIR